MKEAKVNTTMWCYSMRQSITKMKINIR